MALYTIIRVYQVPAGNRLEATDRMLEALTLGVEDDFHVKDVLREPDGTPGSGVRVSLKPPKGWGTLLLDQLLGRATKTKPQLTAFGTPQHYFDLAMEHPELASRDDQQPVDARYAWFAGQALYTAQTLRTLVGGERAGLPRQRQRHQAPAERDE